MPEMNRIETAAENTYSHRELILSASDDRLNAPTTCLKPDLAVAAN
jgi:hypothetical protein